jgi:DNA polymerase-3 subunit delta
MDQEAARLLVAHVGTSLRTLDGELSKLVLFVGARDSVSADDVASIVGISRDFSVFELQRALGSGDGARAVSILEHLLDGGENPGFLLVMLTSYFVALWKVHELTRTETARGAIAAEIRVSPYFVQEYLAGARRFSVPAIEDALCSLAEADTALKTTQANPRQILHPLLARLLSGMKAEN